MTARNIFGDLMEGVAAMQGHREGKLALRSHKVEAVPLRKITVEVPLELLQKAQRASGGGITQTVRTGLQLVATSRTYARLRQLRGKVRFTRT